MILRAYFVHFNPHFRKGSDLLEMVRYKIDIKISIHTSAREVTLRTVLAGQSVNFNPHFRKGSDATLTQTVYIYKISIHTSAREVTQFDDIGLTCDSFISIHTSAREVTGFNRNC